MTSSFMEASMRRLAIISSLLLTLTLSSIATPAQRPRDGEGRRGMRGRIAQELNLTDEQKERLRAIHEAERPNVEAAREDVRAKRRALDEAVTAEPVNRALVDQRTRELGDAQANLLRVTTSVRLKAREVFTPEQRAQLRTLRDERRERGRLGKRRGGS